MSDPIIDATDTLTEDEELEAVYRHIFMGQTQADVAEVLDTSSSTVGRVVREARTIRGVEHEILDRFTDRDDTRDDADRTYLTRTGRREDGDEDEETESVRERLETLLDEQ